VVSVSATPPHGGTEIGAGPFAGSVPRGTRIGERTLGAIWKYAAYAAGPRALEAVVAITTDAPLPGWLRPQEGPYGLV
jgi:hypothetical protein